tara:strand:+ start:52 stop:213 length:162 start_codon:yes stop_codon:yes gene_type:complete
MNENFTLPESSKILEQISAKKAGQISVSFNPAILEYILFRAWKEDVLGTEQIV